jgi:hypothetical protein
MKKRLTPQEKKILSYVRDGRNLFAESRSIAHRAIAKRKAWVNKSYRKSTSQRLLPGAPLEEESLALLELAARAVERHPWRKVPDVPLAQFIEWKNKYGWGGRNRQSSSALRAKAQRLGKRSRRGQP